MEDLTTEDLSRHFLQGTSETIPQFSQVLDLFRGQVPMIIELKSVDNNYAELWRGCLRHAGGLRGPLLHRVLRPPVRPVAPAASARTLSVDSWRKIS